MVASVALGVVDDDTIHFINRYRREVAAGATTDDAIETATAHEGRASLTTAIINSCGFARAAAVGVQADRLVRRAAGADDGGRVPRGSVHPAGDHQADAGDLRGGGAAAAAIRRMRRSGDSEFSVQEVFAPGLLILLISLRPARHPRVGAAAERGRHHHGRLPAEPEPDVGAAGARLRGAGPRPDAADALHVVRLRRRAPRAPGSRAAAGTSRRDRRDPSRPGGERAVHGGAVRSARRLQPRRVGPARRGAADRRRQPARRVAVLLRRAQRGAAAGRADPGAGVPLGRRHDRGSLRAVLPARAVRSARRADVAVQHRRGLRAGSGRVSFKTVGGVRLSWPP